MKVASVISKFIKVTGCLMATAVGIASAQENQTLNDIKKEGTIKVCTTGGFIPFSSYTSTGWVGFDIDMMNAFSKSLDVKLDIINYNIDGIIPALSTKKCDLIAAGMTITEERKKSVLFSDSYFKDGIVYMYKKNNSKLSKIKSVSELNDPKFKIGVKLGTTNDFFATKNLSKATVLKFNEYLDIINAVRNNKVDAIIIDLNHGKIMDKKFSGIFVYKPTDSNDEHFGVAARLADKELVKKFNEFLKEWKSSGKYDKEFEKYFK